MSVIPQFRFLQPKRTACLLKNVIRVMSTQHQHFLTLDNINPNIIKMHQMTHEPLAVRAVDLEKQLRNGVQKPFTEVLRPDVADSQAMGQPPITFIRQVLSVVFYPQLLDNPAFPADVKERARTILGGCSGGSIGSYTEAGGIVIIRKHVAEFIEKRDGIPCNWENIVLFSGVTDGTKKLLKLFIKETNGKKAGVMTPIPQYPLYSVTLEEFGLHQINYYLNESRNWELDIQEMEKSINEARKVCNPKVLVVINPGNPTGQVLTRKNIEEIIRFAHKENLYIIANEDYQGNIYTEDSQFHSFKKVMTEMGDTFSNVEIASFMSCSKGYTSEAGVRAGFAEIINMCPEVKAMFHKANTAVLCPSATGQACIEPIVRPPSKGEPSHELYIKEKKDILDSLKLRAKLTMEALNALEGITCNEIQAAVFAFPSLKLSPKAVNAAKNANKTPDEFYCDKVLESTGICLVPGGMFGQVPGTYHFQMTILLPVDKTKVMLEKLEDFHKRFMNKYR